MKWLDKMFGRVYTVQEEIEILRTKARVASKEAAAYKKLSRSYQLAARSLEARLANQERQSHVRNRKEQAIQPDGKLHGASETP